MEECKMTNKKKNLGQYKYHLMYGVTHNVLASFVDMSYANFFKDILNP